MTESRPTDHWNLLAQQLGAAPAPEPEPEAKPTEPAENEAPADELLPASAAERDIPSEEEPPAVSKPVTVHVPPPPSKPCPPPRPAAAKPKSRNHWRNLAATLGIEVSEPEPEEPEEPEVAEAVALSAAPVAPPQPPAPVISPPKPVERDLDVGARRRSDWRREDQRPSLFEDPNLSLDTPGVLDAVFDEIEPEAVAEPHAILQRREPERPDSEPESRERSASQRLDELLPDDREEQDIEEAPREAAAELAEAGEPSEAGGEERPSRRRRPRRRRRGGRRDLEPAEETAREETKAADLADEESAERRIAPVRESVAEVDEDDQEREDEDHFGDEDDEEDNGERLKLKHKKIPTWQQAIDAIISANMEARIKNPSGGGGGARGRGRRWRR